MNRSIINAISTPSPMNSTQPLEELRSTNELKSFRNESGSNTNIVSLEDNSLTGNSTSSSFDDCDRIEAVKFFECSSKSGQNVETSVQSLAHEVEYCSSVKEWK